jgi:hypothetical protein
MIKKISRQVNARGRPVVFFKLIKNWINFFFFL